MLGFDSEEKHTFYLVVFSKIGLLQLVSCTITCHQDQKIQVNEQTYGLEIQHPLIQDRNKYLNSF